MSIRMYLCPVFMKKCVLGTLDLSYFDLSLPYTSATPSLAIFCDWVTAYHAHTLFQHINPVLQSSILGLRQLYVVCSDNKYGSIRNVKQILLQRFWWSVLPERLLPQILKSYHISRASRTIYVCMQCKQTAAASVSQNSRALALKYAAHRRHPNQCSYYWVKAFECTMFANNNSTCSRDNIQLLCVSRYQYILTLNPRGRFSVNLTSVWSFNFGSVFGNRPHR